MASPHVSARIDLSKILANARTIRAQVGVSVLAVVKSDAYGLGVQRVAPAIADLVDGFCFFSFAEAATAGLWDKLKKQSIVLGPPGGEEALQCQRLHIRPAVSTPGEARIFGLADPVLSVDTGMQRFTCSADCVEEAMREGGCREAMTHATRPEQARTLLEMLGNRGLRLHAASSSLLQCLEARLDAVRPGIALYRGALRVATRLVEARDSTGPVGYSGFVVRRHGVILAGYSHGLRVGPCIVNGRPSRVLEVGMQSAYVECTGGDKPGDEVILLGESLTEENVAAQWGTTPHLVLSTLARSGNRTYLDPGQ